jgi:hypothetical protein
LGGAASPKDVSKHVIAGRQPGEAVYAGHHLDLALAVDHERVAGAVEGIGINHKQFPGVIRRDAQACDWIRQVVEDSIEERYIEGAKVEPCKRGEVEGGELDVFTRKMFREEPRLVYPVFPDVEPEASASAKAGGGEEVTAGVARAVQERTSRKPPWVDLGHEPGQAALRRDHRGRAEFGWVSAGRCGFAGADAGDHFDVMVPGAKSNDSVTYLLCVHRVILSSDRRASRSEIAWYCQLNF